MTQTLDRLFAILDSTTQTQNRIPFETLPFFEELKAKFKSDANSLGEFFELCVR